MSELEPLEEGEEPVAGSMQQGLLGERSGAHGRAITQDMLVRAVEKQATTRAPQGGDIIKMLARQTHMHLNGQRISVIANLHLLKQLQVLYLYDNQIVSMSDGLSTLRNVTHLYLQNNNITHIDGISNLSNLSKLYLQGNMIARVENLQGLRSLEELHLSNQRLPPDTGLTFEVTSMHAVSGTLRTLVAAGCGIGDEAAAMLPPLPQLRKLDLSNNQMEIVECLEVVMRSADRLTLVELHGNPFCKAYGAPQKYRDAVILMSDSMTRLDGEEVTQAQRAFLLRFQLQKLKVQVAAEHAIEEHPAGVHAQHQGFAHSAGPSQASTGVFGSRRQLGGQPSMQRGGGGSFRAKADKAGGDGGFDLPTLTGTRIR